MHTINQAFTAGQIIQAVICLYLLFNFLIARRFWNESLAAGKPLSHLLGGGLFFFLIGGPVVIGQAIKTRK